MAGPCKINDSKRLICTLLLMLAIVFPSATAFGEAIDDLEAGFRAQRAGNYDLAISFYTKVIRDRDLTARDRAVSYLLRGEAQKDKGDYAAAVKDFSRAIKIKPNYSQAFYFRGLAWEKLDKIAEAYQDVRQALAYSPENDTYQRKLEVLKILLTERGETPPEP
jgi:tetratricopeptide (TPR) repeat protein